MGKIVGARGLRLAVVGTLAFAAAVVPSTVDGTAGAGAATHATSSTHGASVTGPKTVKQTAPDVGARSAADTFQTNGVVWALAYADGVMYVAGKFSSVRPARDAAGTGEVPRTDFAAFDARSGALLSCSPTFALSGGSATVRVLTASPDGSTLYAGGEFDSVDGSTHHSLVALQTSSCSVDPGFDPSVGGIVLALAIRTGSPLYLGGGFHDVDTATRNLAAAVDPGTGALTPFDPDAATPSGSTRYTSMRALTISPAGTQVFLGGDFDRLAGQAVQGFAAVDATSGTVVRTFAGLIPSNSTVETLTHGSTDLYLGSQGAGPTGFDGRASINMTSGKVNWRDTCAGATQALLLEGSTLFSGSHAHNCSSTPGGFPAGDRHHLLAQRTSDSTILPWFPNTNGGIGESLGPRALAMSPDGTLWVGGEFTKVNGVRQEGLARFAPKPDNNLPAAPTPTLRSYLRGTILVRVRTVADPDQGTLLYRIYRGHKLVYRTAMASRFFDHPQVLFLDRVKPGTRHRYRVVVSDPRHSTSPGPTLSMVALRHSNPFVAAALADRPEHLWRLDDKEGTYGADSAGHDPLILPTAHVHYRTAGRTVASGTGLTLLSTGTAYSGMRGMQADNVQKAPSTVTEQAWFRTKSTSGGELIGFGNGSRTNGGSGTSTKDSRHVYLTDGGHLIFSAGGVSLRSARVYNNNAWHQVTASIGKAGTRLYVDGRLVASSSRHRVPSARGEWWVGNGYLAGSRSAPRTDQFAGSLQDIALYPRQLSSKQVAHEYRASAPAARR